MEAVVSRKEGAMRPTKVILSILLVSLSVAFPAWADVGIPDLTLSYSWCEYAGPDRVVVVNFPNGGGRRLDEGRTMGGVVNATIHMVLLDAMGYPFFNYPREDMWLDSSDAHLALCREGSLADANTDMNGETSWVLPIQAGGYSEDFTQVMIAGMPIISSEGLNVHFNSPDINGDLLVNLSDVVLFARDFFGEYQFRSDFRFDGVIDMHDLVVLAEGLGAACP